MWLVFVFFILLILEIIFSSINIEIKNFDLSKNHSDFNIDVNLIVFRFIKILRIHFNKNGIKIFNKKIPYKDFLKDKYMKFNLDEFNAKEVLEILKCLNLRIDRANFSLKLGLEDIFLTSITVVIISSIISIILGKNLLKVNLKNVNYKVIPEFNKINLEYRGNISISFRFLEIIKIYFKILNEKKKENSKTVQKSIRIES